jgi:dTDP-L-rhamnose 4-epimerase
MNILITGGAGFIGSFVADQLLAAGHRVRAYDNFEPQVHRGERPDYLHPDVEVVAGDVCDPEGVDRALAGVDVVFHFAAMVGVGQSMHEIARYTRVNDVGTGVLLDQVVNKHRDHVRKMVVAGSMSEYGEGLGLSPARGPIKPPLRGEEQLARRDWEVRCPETGEVMTPLPTHERVPLECNSIYAINKRTQEDMVLNIGRAFGIPATSLRFFNAYGPRQSLSNPYTGVAAIFISQIKAGKAPTVFEDGLQTRDFVSVHDIAAACVTVMESPATDYLALNVGSGSKIRVADLAAKLCGMLPGGLAPQITQNFRKGDIRHCFSDISLITKLTGWTPKADMDACLQELIEWGSRKASVDLTGEAHAIQRAKGIL